jgi:integral membrane protein
VLAIVVGILLTSLVFVAMPLKYLLTEGTGAQVFGDHLTTVVAVGHGYLYLAYLLVSFLLWRQTRWPLPFAVLVLLAGLLPVLIFFIERMVNRRVRRENPELVTAPG